MYAKLFTSIYQGTLRGNAHGLLVFTNLLAHCDKHGEVDIHPRAIAEEVGLTVDQVRVAVRMLEQPDSESRSPDLEGRRIVRLDEHRDWGWRVVNFLKYRAIRDEDDRREQNRLAQERWRNKNKPASAAGEIDKPIQKQDTEAEAKTRKTRKTARKRAAPLARPQEVAEQVWADWLQLRAAKRAPVTATVLEGAQFEAEKAGMTLEAFLRVWCRRGSQGLEAAWLNPDERGGVVPASAEPAWRAEKRQRTAEFLNIKPATQPKEVFDVTARIVG